MMHLATRHAQRGMMTLFVSLVMLLLITAMVMTAFTLSTTNLRAVGNMQTRNEAIAAASVVIAQEMSSFTDTPVAVVDFPVDINGDGVDDYLVSVAEPVCIRATPATITSSSSVTLPGMSSSAAWNTIWDFDAVVNDPVTGASVRVREGMRVLLSEAERDDICG